MVWFTFWGCNRMTGLIILLAETSFCWAFSISTMIRHSLNYFLAQLAKERPMRFDNEILGEAIQYLNSLDFHKKLRIGSEAPISIVSIFYSSALTNQQK